MKTAWKKYAFIACAGILTFIAAMSVRGQAAPDAASLGDQLRLRYDVVGLRDGVGLVPRQPQADIRLIEIRNGGVAINGDTVSAAEVRQRLGRDAEMILRVTYLDAAGQSQLVRGDAAGGAAQAQPELPERTPTRRGDLVRFGSNVTVARDEVVEGDVVVIGGSARIDGEVMQEVTVIGGRLTLGPDAIVRRDVTVVGGSLDRSPGARVYGKIDDVGFGERARFTPWFGRGFSFWTPLSRLSGLFGTFLRITVLILSALAVVALGRQFVEAIADRTAAEAVRAGLAGLLTEVLFVPLLILTIVVLAVSIIGIPLLLLVPFGIVLVVVAMLVGFTGVACQAGRLVCGRFGIEGGPYRTVAIGVAAIVGITLVAKIIALAGGFVFGMIVAGPLAAVGYLAEYLAWTIGIGAVILTWLSMRRNGAAAAAGPAPAAGGTQAE
jgi:hypothetical protein